MRLLALPLSLLIAAAVSAQTPMTLEQCLARAEERNLNLRNAALDVNLAEEAHDQAYWSFLPNLNGAVTHGYNWGKTIDQYTNTFATDRVRTNNLYLSSDVTLFQSGRKHQELKRAALDEQSATKAYEAALNDLRTNVVRAYLDLLGLKEQQRAAEDQAASTKEQSRITEAMVDAGRVARADLLDIQAQQAQEEYTVEDYKIQVEKARLTLGQLMQMDQQEMAGLTIEAPAIAAIDFVEPTATEDEVLRNVLATNPAYAQADLSAQSAERSIAIAKAIALPSVSFNASLGTGYSGRNFEFVGAPVPEQSVLIGATDSGEPVYAPSFSQATQVKSLSQQLSDNLNESIGFTLSVPIFNNMQNRYNTAQSKIQYERAKNQVLVSKNALMRDVQNALTAQRGAYRQYISASKAVEASTESERMANERFTQQSITATDLNIAKARLQQSTAQLINAKYTYLMAQKSLDILQGRPVTL
ncbi:MAG: TolC family protein [Flavobacteriales bacterium]|nr:TolC family protein [Flavobacteriales bacterium]